MFKFKVFKMKKILIITSLLLFLLTSCTRTECKDCTKLFETILTNNELDSIVQNLPNYYSADSINYINWNEFVSLNISTLEHEIDQAIEVCSVYGGMVSVDPLGDKEDETIVWYSNGSSSDLTLPPAQTIELVTVYYNCQ